MRNIEKWSYRELHHILNFKCGHMFMVDDHSGKITWPPSAKEIIKIAGWTKKELVKHAANM